MDKKIIKLHTEEENKHPKLDSSKKSFTSKISNILQSFLSTARYYKNNIKEFLQEETEQEKIRLWSGESIIIRYLKDKDKLIDDKYRTRLMRWFDKDWKEIEHYNALLFLCKKDEDFMSKYVITNDEWETEQELGRCRTRKTR